LTKIIKTIVKFAIILEKFEKIWENLKKNWNNFRTFEKIWRKSFKFTSKIWENFIIY